MWNLDVTVTSDCNDSLDRYTSTLYTPNYPQHYNISQLCTWTFEVEIGRRVKLNAFSYSIEDDVSCTGDCCYDYLTIHDGRNSNATKLVSLCGNGKHNDIVSSGRYLFVKFKSDTVVTKTGFQIHYEIISK